MNRRGLRLADIEARLGDAEVRHFALRPKKPTPGVSLRWACGCSGYEEVSDPEDGRVVEFDPCSNAHRALVLGV